MARSDIISRAGVRTLALLLALMLLSLGAWAQAPKHEGGTTRLMVRRIRR